MTAPNAPSDGGDREPRSGPASQGTQPPGKPQSPIGRIADALPPWATRRIPVLSWGSTYTSDTFAADALAAVIVTIMLIPQSLAYAMLAGLPPVTGLYSSILPIVAYAVFGSSRTLAVGPVAVISLMTASAIGATASAKGADPAAVALILALLSGAMMILMGIWRMGAIANLLSHPVVSGFITASAILIAAGQAKHLLGISASGSSLIETLRSLLANLGSVNPVTLALGAFALWFLWWSRGQLKPLLIARGFGPRTANALSRAAPVFAVAATTFATWALSLDKLGVKIVGSVPQGLPPLTLPMFDATLWLDLLLPALLISVVGFVESVSVGQTLAARKRERIDPDQELIGLGAANVAASLSGGFPVTGGFARSVVNDDAGAATPAAGAYAALGILAAAVFLTPLLYFLPHATLAATVIVAVLSLADFGAIGRTWSYSRSDATALVATIAATLAFGVEIGIGTGIAVSLALYFWQTSQPHVAVVGLVPGTQHFRNVDRHKVVTSTTVLTVRIDESLSFVNARFLEETLGSLVAQSPAVKDVILMCSAINRIDYSALESLEAINRNLHVAGVTFHLSEVKGPVMDRLNGTHLKSELTGRIFLSQFDAFAALDSTRAGVMPGQNSGTADD